MKACRHYMPLSILLWLSFFYIPQVNAHCEIAVKEGLNNNTITVEAGEESDFTGRTILGALNTGDHDVKLWVQQGFFAGENDERLNPGEYKPFTNVSLNRVECLTTASNVRNAAEIAFEQLDNAVESVNEAATGVQETINQGIQGVGDAVNDAGTAAHDFTKSLINKGKQLGENALDGLKGWDYLGRARNCLPLLGNTDNQFSNNQRNIPSRGARGNKNKFKNLVITSEYRHINDYLLMQSSNKTYYQQVKHGVGLNGKWKEAKNEDEFRCGIQELYHYWGFDDVMFANTKNNANAVIGEDNQKIVISVRGTQNPLAFNLAESQLETALEGYNGAIDTLVNSVNTLVAKDILSNNEFAETAFNQILQGKLPDISSNANVHFGYALAAIQLSALIETALIDMKAGNKPIFVTGHSLGGATATVLAYRLKKRKYNIKAAYVYAPPKVGDKKFNEDIKQTIPLYLSWNYRDPVPTNFRNDFYLSPNAVANFGLQFIPNGTKFFEPTMEAARRITYFNKQHEAVVLNTSEGSKHQRFLSIREDQGAPYPTILFRNGLMSDEWHFHNGNFYIAFVYDNLLKESFVPVAGSNIEPEFEKSKMCLMWDVSMNQATYDWNASYRRFLRDKNGYPFHRCIW